jgi:hypothetical protein
VIDVTATAMAGRLNPLHQQRSDFDRKGAVTMSTIINRAESCERERQTDALSDRELANVSGGKGKATPSPFVFIKHYDKASPVLA